MNLASHTISVQGNPVSVLRGGNGTRVLLLHGWGSRAESYRDFFLSYPENEGEFVVPDLPGFGNTPAPQTTWGVDEYALWVHDLLDALGWETPVLIMGHSFGGQIALAAANTYPRRVSGLILYAAAIIRPAHAFRRKTANIVSFLLRPLFPFRRVIGYIGKMYDWGRTSPEMKPIMQRVIRQDLSHLLPNIRIPVIVLWGDKDRRTPLAHGMSIAQELQHSEMRVVPGAGHSVRNDNPDQFRKELLRAIQCLSS